MTQTTSTQPTNLMVYLGGIILAGFVIYFCFWAMNNLGLPEQSGTATVIGKAFHPAGKTYTTQKVGDRMLTVPQSTAEMYILALRIDEKETAFAAPKAIYDGLSDGARVNVIFKRKRLTGGLQVVSVTR